MADRFSCALASCAFDEPLYGTASQIRGWLLIEQPGPWGRDAIAESGLPGDVADRLRVVARRARARLLLIRRHGRSAPAQRTCYAAVSTPDVRRVERFIVDDPADLLEIDWTRLRRLEPVGGEVIDHPLYLVCTNGGHDACCARFGRPVARALDDALGAQVWEASHFGGDRFAGNLVCLPDGIYYGRVRREDALRLVVEHQARRLDLDHYRGRSFLVFAAQAAEHFVRESRGVIDVDGALPQEVAEIADGVFRIIVALRDGVILAVVVACQEAVDPQRLTCHSSTEEHPPRYRLVAIDELSPRAG